MSSSSYEIYLCQSDCDLQHQTVPTNAYLVWGNAWYFLIGEKAFFRYHHQSEDPATSFTGLAKPQQGCGPGCGGCCLTFLPVGPECRYCGAWCISFELTIHIRRVGKQVITSRLICSCLSTSCKGPAGYQPWTFFAVYLCARRMTIPGSTV